MSPTPPRDGHQVVHLVGALGRRIAAIRVAPGEAPAHLPGSPFALSHKGSFSVVADRTRGRLYAAHLFSGHIDVLRAEPDGSLRPLAGSPYRSGSPAGGLAIDPRDRFVYATCVARNRGGAAVRSFRVTDEGLEPIGAPVPTGGLLGDGIALPAVSPDGRSLYVAGYLSATVMHFRIAEDGSLSPVRQRIRSGPGPVSPTVAPDGRALYVVNEFGATASGFRIEEGGGLVEMAGSPFPVGRFPHGITLSADGRRAYVPNLFGRSIHGFAVAPDGALDPLPGSPYPTTTPRGLPGRVLLSADGTRLYLVELGSATRHPHAMLCTYAIGPDGALRPTGDRPLDTGILFADGPGSVISTAAP